MFPNGLPNDIFQLFDDFLKCCLSLIGLIEIILRNKKWFIRIGRPFRRRRRKI